MHYSTVAHGIRIFRELGGALLNDGRQRHQGKRRVNSRKSLLTGEGKYAKNFQQASA